MKSSTYVRKHEGGLADEIMYALMRYHGCIVHNGPGSGPCLADMKRTDLIMDLVTTSQGDPAEVLREAAEALNKEGVGFRSGWGSNPTDQQSIDMLAKAVQWLRDRAGDYEAGKRVSQFAQEHRPSRHGVIVDPDFIEGQLMSYNVKMCDCITPWRHPHGTV